MYLHYAWCHHSCAVAVKRGIVVEIPGADPTPLETGKKKVGRPTKARGGEALKKD